MKKWKLTASLIALMLILPGACIAYEQITAPAYNENSIVFIEHLNHTRGKLISGDYPRQALEGSIYHYDAGNRSLTGNIGLSDKGSLKALLGVGENMVQDAGYGVSNMIFGVYSTPEKFGDLIVEDIMDNGTIKLNYGGSSIVLAPGERWEKISSEILECPDYRIRMISSDSIRNNGIIPISNIKTI
ncbi:hypothetical protein CUJ83_10885 [Methanocella sp. CWC-04]|uniref:Uncharacterized protein n=1 Tax=Methanooceanicella nereidis TaxID=2052831 RepID=A0AAP2RDD7_9EURY|nr:hypothetical protein [Methanocella sp. CWC-04]MCD1295504.1 hypothetical protein [Methanocella sp. CWC-04]